MCNRRHRLQINRRTNQAPVQVCSRRSNRAISPLTGPVLNLAFSPHRSLQIRQVINHQCNHQLNLRASQQRSLRQNRQCNLLHVLRFSRRSSLLHNQVINHPVFLPINHQSIHLCSPHYNLLFILRSSRR